MIPPVIEHYEGGTARPLLKVRVEVGEHTGGVPKLAELTLTAEPGEPGVRQSDLRAISVENLVEDAVAAFAVVVNADGSVSHADETGTRREVARARGPRRITTELLGEVAGVYRDNVADAPVRAVATHFGVSRRSAAEYVSRARQSGLLPATDRGRKRA